MNSTVEQIRESLRSPNADRAAILSDLIWDFGGQTAHDLLREAEKAESKSSTT